MRKKATRRKHSRLNCWRRGSGFFWKLVSLILVYLGKGFFSLNYCTMNLIFCCGAVDLILLSFEKKSFDLGMGFRAGFWGAWGGIYWHFGPKIFMVKFYLALIRINFFEKGLNLNLQQNFSDKTLKNQ